MYGKSKLVFGDGLIGCWGCGVEESSTRGYGILVLHPAAWHSYPNRVLKSKSFRKITATAMEGRVTRELGKESAWTCDETLGFGLPFNPQGCSPVW